MQDVGQNTSMGFFSRIEALRGLAALTVAAMHSWQTPWTDAGGKTYSYLQIPDTELYWRPLASVLKVVGTGVSAVNLFFVISGFVLALSLVRAGGALGPSTVRFAAARAFRIYPAVFATVVIFTLLFWTTGACLTTAAAFEPWNVVKNTLLIKFDINGVMWSLQMEMLAVSLIFFGYVLMRVFGLWALLALLLVLGILSFHGPWVWLMATPYGLALLPSFVLGMLAYFVGMDLVRRLPPKFVPALFVVAVAGFYLTKPVLGEFMRWTPIVEAWFATGMVAFLAYGAVGRIGRFFDQPIVRFYGRISYSFYLLHPLTFMVFWSNPHLLGAVVQAGVPHAVIIVGVAVVSTLVVTPLAWVMYHWVERPGAAVGRALIRAPRSASVASA